MPEPQPSHNCTENMVNSGLRPYPPTRRQLELLRYIAGYQEAHAGVSPSFAECRDALGLKSKGNVAQFMDCLEVRRLIRRLPNRARTIFVLHKPAIPRAPDGSPLFFVGVA